MDKTRRKIVHMEGARTRLGDLYEILLDIETYTSEMANESAGANKLVNQALDILRTPAKVPKRPQRRK